MPQLIGLTGRAGSGKDTAAEFLVDQGWVQLSFAAPIRSFVADLMGVDVDAMAQVKEQPQDVLCGRTPRYAMQTLGTEWGRDCIGWDFWITACMTKARSHLEAGRSVVISDVRFDNEAQVVTDAGGTIVEIRRPSQRRIEGDHVSEAGITHSLIHHTIINPEGDMDAFNALVMSYIKASTAQVA